jgi:predicted nucleic acid-binding protein
VIAYFDTSALIPLLVDEPTSVTAARLWSASDRVVSVRLVTPEARAALAMARRLGRLSGPGLATAKGGLELLLAQLDQVELTQDLARRAGDLAEEQALRGYDAVHVAAAERINDADLVFVSSDAHQQAAARQLGMSIATLGA